MSSRRLIDLHCHSTCSDGSLTPTELAELAALKGLAAVALTDHDNLHAWPEFSAACRRVGVEPIEGVEISSIWEEAPDRPRTVDILGYLFDPTDATLTQTLDWMLRVRSDRNGMILEKLAALGMPIDREELRAEAGSEVVGRPHFAAVMVRRGYVADRRSAFDKYLADGAAAWVPKARLGPAEAVALLAAAGGRAVIAHPYVLPLADKRAYAAFLAPLVEAGLAGLECDYPEHTSAQRRMFNDLAKEFGIVATGGSDFHGEARPGTELGTGRGDLAVDYAVLDALRARRVAAKSSSD